MNTTPPTDDALLSDEMKKRILLEETYRSEVQKQLADNTPKSKADKWLDFFNSSLGIWILSTCVVGLATFIYNYYTQQSQAIADAEKEKAAAFADSLNTAQAKARDDAATITSLLPYLTTQNNKQRIMAIAISRYLDSSGDLPSALYPALAQIASDTAALKTGEDLAVAKAAAYVFKPRVYMAIPDSTRQAVANNTKTMLIKNGYFVPGVTGKLPKNKVPSETEVRYFKTEDKNEALRIATLLFQKVGVKATAVPQTGVDVTNKPPSYEIWFSR